jgi:uncharacterized membrane protein
MNVKKIANKIKFQSEKALILFFVIMAILGGCMFSFLMPEGTIPDEMTHLEYVVYSCGLVDYYRPIETALHEAGVNNIAPGQDNHLNIEQYKAAANKENEIGLPLQKLHFNRFVFKYFPAVIGLIIGAALKLSYMHILRLCALCSLAFYIFMGVLTIKAAPVKKYVFTFCLLLPMSLHMAASINYDTILIPMCFYLTAYLLKLKCSKDKIKWKDILILAVVSFFILYIKVIYILLILMILAIPLDRFDLKIGKKHDIGKFVKKHKLPLILACFALIAVGAYLCRNNNYVVILTASILEWKRTLVMLRDTLNIQWDAYKLWYTGCFGSLDTYVPMTFANRIFIFMGILILYFDKKADAGYEKIQFRDRGLFLLIVAMIFVLIFLSMTTWTLHLSGIDPYVSVGEMRKNLYKFGTYMGVQGRYFIPITPLFMISLSGIGPMKKLTCNKLFYPVFALFVLYVMQFITRLLLYAYWLNG